MIDLENNVLDLDEDSNDPRTVYHVSGHYGIRKATLIAYHQVTRGCGSPFTEVVVTFPRDVSDRLEIVDIVQLYDNKSEAVNAFQKMMLQEMSNISSKLSKAHEE